MRFTIELLQTGKPDKEVDKSDNIFEARHMLHGWLKKLSHENGSLGIFDNRENVWLELENIRKYWVTQ